MRVGVSGWRYSPWRGRFYPVGLPARKELAHASRRFDALEINGTFYSLQQPESFARWYEQTPRGFRFAVKGGRFITHMKRLANVRAPLANFFASGVLRLEEKLGPFLWQLPASFHWDEERLDAFLGLLPRSFSEAARLARHRDARTKGRAWLRYRHDRPLYHALEVRHESFFREDFAALLRRHRVALVASHTDGRWPYTEELTAGFVYLRLHGPGRLYASDYDSRALERWAHRIEAWQRGDQPRDAETFSGREPPRRRVRDVWVFFDNTDKVHAPANAERLRRRLGEPPRGR